MPCSGQDGTGPGSQPQRALARSSFTARPWGPPALTCAIVYRPFAHARSQRRAPTCRPLESRNPARAFAPDGGKSLSAGVADARASLGSGTVRACEWAAAAIAGCAAWTDQRRAYGADACAPGDFGFGDAGLRMRTARVASRRVLRLFAHAGRWGCAAPGAGRRRQADIDVRARTLCVQLRRGVLRARCKPRARSGAELPFGGGGGLVRVPDVSTPCRFRRRQRGWPVTRTVYKPAIEIAHDSIAPFRKGGTIHCRRVNICVFVRAPLMRRSLHCCTWFNAFSARY